jgi:hypothetical protein
MICALYCPGFKAMQDGVDMYCQEDQMLGKYVNGFVAGGEARQCGDWPWHYPRALANHR